MDMHGGDRGVARCRKSIHMSPDVYDGGSTQADFPPNHSKLRPRSRKQTRYI